MRTTHKPRLPDTAGAASRAPRRTGGGCEEPSSAQSAIGNRATAELTERGEGGLEGSGRPMPLPFREQMERSFGQRLDGIKVRVGAPETTLAADAGALTMGNTIVFGVDRPDREMVAHEVAHVVQNRSSAQAARSGVSSPTSSAEHEAHDIGKKVASGASAVSVGAAPAAAVHRGPKDWLKRNFGKSNKSQVKSNPTSVTSLGGGTANAVDKVTYDTPIGDSQTRSGYFKANNKEAGGKLGTMSSRAVASSNLAKALGLDVIADEQFAEVDGKTGSVSADVGDATPLKKDVFEEEISKERAEPLIEMGHQIKKRDDKYFMHSGEDYQDVDYSRPETQRGLFDLQAFDAIVGQSDRHGGNIMVDNKSGKVTGIDNDLAMTAGENVKMSGDAGEDVGKLDQKWGKYRGLPSMMDKQTAKKIKKFDFSRKNLRRVLDDPSLPEEHRLTDADYMQLKQRGRAMQAHVKGLKKSGGLVDTWDDTTYQKAKDDVIDNKGMLSGGNYLSDQSIKLDEQKAKAPTVTPTTVPPQRTTPPVPTTTSHPELKIPDRMPPLPPTPGKKPPSPNAVAVLPPLPTGPKPVLKPRPLGRKLPELV